MDLSTEYLGIKLPHPFIAGAGPMADTVSGAKQLEDGGAAALVTRSLFDEQVTEISPAAGSEEGGAGQRTSDQFLERLRKIKEAVDIPVFASYNGYDLHGIAESIERVGADAIELNLYYVPVDPTLSSADIEEWGLEAVSELNQTIKIPVAVKLSPFYTSLANFVLKLENTGARGLVLFNRFFEGDIDVEKSEILPSLQLSDSRELLLRLRWLSILSTGISTISLAVTGGVHSAVDAVKALMCGASAIQVVSALLKHGPDHMTAMHKDLRSWMEEAGYDSLRGLRGSVEAFHSRSDYMRLLQTWKWG